MDPCALSVLQLRHILKQYQLPSYGRKVEMISRMQQADPAGAWMQEAARYHPEVNPEEGGQKEGTAQAREDARPVDRLSQRETELLVRENSLMQREIDLLRRENEALRMSPRNGSSTVSRATLSIKDVSDLLNEYNGSGDDFERWKAEVNLLRDTYELDENAAKVLVGSKLRGKAADWYHSLVEHLATKVDRLLEQMDAMFNQPMSRLEKERLLENRMWEKGETFNDYCLAKVILGNKVPVAEEEMVKYIIDGIPSRALRNQARMHSFSTVIELTKGLRRISLEIPDILTTRREYSAGVKNSKTKTIVPLKTVTKDGPRVKGVVRCYQCDEKGHCAEDCPAKKKKPRKTSVSRMKDGKADRQVDLLDDRRLAAANSGLDSDVHSEADDEIQLVELHVESRDEPQKVTELQIQGLCTAFVYS